MPWVPPTVPLVLPLLGTAGGRMTTLTHLCGMLCQPLPMPPPPWATLEVECFPTLRLLRLPMALMAWYLTLMTAGMSTLPFS